MKNLKALSEEMAKLKKQISEIWTASWVDIEDGELSILESKCLV